MSLELMSFDEGLCPIERGRQDKEGRQRALCEAAVAVFGERGFDAATTREIAERAGCSEGLIHRYFSNKRGLLLAVLKQRAERMSQQFDGEIDGCGSLEEELSNLFDRTLDQMWRERDFMRVSVSQSAIDPEIGRTVGQLYSRRRRELIESCLEAHMKAGEIAADVDIVAIADVINGVGFAAGFMAQVAFARDAEELRRHLHEFARVLANSLAPNQPSARTE